MMMSLRSIMGHVIALLAAGVIVLTGVYLAVLWHNQSPERVLAEKAGDVIYKTSSMAIGDIHQSGREMVTLLRFSRDGGWVVEATGTWVDIPQVRGQVRIALLPNNSFGFKDAYWLCAVRSNETLTSISLADPSHTYPIQMFPFHGEGIIEPVRVDGDVEIRGYGDDGRVFSQLWRPRSS
jgi:hypothetical protein